MRTHTFDSSEQQAQVKAFTSSGRNGIHPSNDLVPLTDLPLPFSLHPHKALWEILVEMLPCTSSNEDWICIGLEPSKKR
jgi:hypothetical protein